MLANFQIGSMLISLVVGLCLIAARTRGPLLSFQPRRLVPWNGVGVVLAFVLVSFTLGTALFSGPAPEEEKVAAHVSAQLIAAMTEEVVIVSGFLFLVVAYFNVNWRDLGLPANGRELAHDIFIGVVAGSAALAPIYFIMYALSTPEMKSGHPLVKMISDREPNLGVMLLASLVAVVVAPICEEITFRLLLQGWLEKTEAIAMGAISESSLGGLADDVIPVDDAAQAIGGPASDVGDESIGASAGLVDSIWLSEPPKRGSLGLPYGWMPIVISSVLFGLAHFGYGPEPVPLFFLALLLGYIYNRTHRIVPSIVAHALFNSFAIAALWLMQFGGVH
jgi:membrane protease YdiL (CAAX protease family)